MNLNEALAQVTSIILAHPISEFLEPYSRTKLTKGEICEVRFQLPNDNTRIPICLRMRSERIGKIIMDGSEYTKVRMWPEVDCNFLSSNTRVCECGYTECYMGCCKTEVTDIRMFAKLTEMVSNLTLQICQLLQEPITDLYRTAEQIAEDEYRAKVAEESSLRKKTLDDIVAMYSKHMRVEGTKIIGDTGNLYEGQHLIEQNNGKKFLVTVRPTISVLLRLA